MRKGRTLRAMAGPVIVVLLLATALGARAGMAASGNPATVDELTTAATSPAPSATALPGGDHESDVDGDHNSDVETDNNADTVDGDHDSDHDSDAVGADNEAKVVTSGACSTNVSWQMEAEKDGAALELELTLKGSQANATWLVEIWQNNARFYSASTAASGSGEIEIERGRPDGTGTDTFKFTAREQSNEQTCTGTVSI